jgi:hypothetical protein
MMCNGSSTLACFERLKSELVGRRGGIILTIKRNFGSSLLVEGAIAATATAMAVELSSEGYHATAGVQVFEGSSQLHGKTNCLEATREARRALRAARVAQSKRFLERARRKRARAKG